MARAKDGKRVITSLRLPPSLLKRLQAVSALTKRSQADLVIEALEPLLKREVDRHGIERLVRDFIRQRERVA